MSAGFTPGPWQVELSVMGCRSITCGDDLIASVEDAPRDANARLIAAAPRLYAALEDALPMLRMLAKFGEDNVWRPAERNLQAFEAALAEAQGGAAHTPDPSNERESGQ